MRVNIFCSYFLFVNFNYKLENSLRNGGKLEEKLAIIINATRDVSGSVPIELETKNGGIILKDPFELFFKSSKKARLHYESIFLEIKEWLGEDKESTKLSVFSHTTNSNEIREGKTNIFKILVQINQGEEYREFTIGTLLSIKEIQDRLGNIQINNLENYGLDGIKKSNYGDGYRQLFQIGTGGGTHNVASTLSSLLASVKSDSLKILSPNNVDSKDEGYTIRTSILCHIDGLKICIRTEPETKKIDEIKNELEKNKNLVSGIITTRPEKQNFDNYDIHAIPSHFESNIIKGVKTLVFNGEDREIGCVIQEFIKNIELFLKKENNLEVKSQIINLLQDLKNREARLKDINETFSIEGKGFNDIRKTLEKHTGTKNKRANRIIKGMERYLNKESDTLLDMIIARRYILKDILKYIVFLNQIISNDIIQKNESTVQIKNNSEKGKIFMITDGELGGIGVINTNGYEVFFENLILEIGDGENKLFEYLKKLTSGIIDLDIKDTTGCGDSSITACMMMREKEIYKIRERNYIYLFNNLGLNKDDFNKAISISEAFFMSTLQKIISGTVYHCRRSNLGDIPQSKKVSAMLLKYAFGKTIKYINDGQKGIFKHLYSLDDESSSKEKKYKGGFNTYKITKY